MKTNLVIIPASTAALFQEWDDYSECDFDLAVLNWTGKELRNTQDAKYVQNYPGQKWHLIAKLNEEHDLSKYEYIICLDDDVVTTPALLDATFVFCQEHNIDMAQPALLPTPHPWGHPPTGFIAGAKMHITNSAEIMCPIFSQRCWPEAIAMCKDMPLGLGYGLEGYWEQVLETHTGRTKYGGIVAIIDQYPAVHSKPFKTNKEWHALGINPNIDGNWFANQGYGHNWSFRTIEVISE